ncbi:DHA3 family multidrug efflux protein-like MFS transporter [Microbacteriaceae bacterium SG_E_30_P1]|uniref:DHA3 family multidrug efflux protein-like MFS transporter n=1 Tax=Antiquaquibacter oligotrophicus TaxID=2880260 RepID=A0ABT6KSS7_9MICO|nr:MFS transporter [Antiquaquibacter oligotrophicus]MDH6182558.1 DHA3 family multidrug efflux protein-like MFS transporter [Antiquaquibacter oligotrophicus]UDF14475.1 MFS transporter [Antiquaquibacter oligotrophicus]
MSSTTDDSGTPQTPAHEPPAGGLRTFYQVLVNTAIANITTSYLWFALTFWVYLETRSVLATGVIGGAYMLLVAVFSMVFGTIVDRHRKYAVMIFAGTVTLGAFAVAGALYLFFPESSLLNIGGPMFWIFTGVILFGAVVENMRNIALSTTVTLLVPVERHANANGLVGTVQGVAFMVTSVFSGLSVGLLGMGWTMLIAIALTAVALIHLFFLRIPEEQPHVPEKAPFIDLRGSITAVRAATGLFALIIFSTFNNFIGGVYMALMDPYGLELFPVELWGVVLGVTSTGFIIGGLVIAKFGLGRNPIRTMLLLVMLMGFLGATFTLREWWWLYALGIWVYMAIIPAVEAAEQTVIQKVVPFRTQGRVFGFAQAFESAAAPITAFLIAPIAEFIIIPFMGTDAGRQSFGWLLGDGEARGIALVFLVAGLVMVLAAIGAFFTKSYRRISAQYAGQTESVKPDEVPAPDQPADVAGLTDGPR